MSLEIRHVAVLAGIVRDQSSGKPVAGAIVKIVSGPKTFMNTLLIQTQRSEQRDNKVVFGDDRVATQADGHYYFLDLPNGKYELSVSAERAKQAVRGAVEIAREKNSEDRPVRFDTTLELDPPAIQAPKLVRKAQTQKNDTERKKSGVNPRVSS